LALVGPVKLRVMFVKNVYAECFPGEKQKWFL